MFAAVRKYQTTHIDEIIMKIKDDFEPQISMQPGFVAYFAVRTGNDSFVSVSVFESLAQAEASNRLATVFFNEAKLDQYLQPPEISTGEIIASKVKGLPDWVAAVLMGNA